MPEAEFEPTITASERATTVHALDQSATVTGCVNSNAVKINVTEIFLFILCRNTLTLFITTKLFPIKRDNGI
jgi:hypothetical protein